MNSELENVSSNMLELGLGALTHANRLAAYQDFANDKGAELSVLQAAHAAEILIKARIAEEHPLLIFEEFPKTQDKEMSLDNLINEGHTIKWTELPNRLWAVTGEHLDNLALFKEFGNLRNTIQHFGAVPSGISPSYEALKFIYGIIDPFINKHWNLYAIDFDEDDTPYENFLGTLISYEIKFLVSNNAAECHTYWDEDLQNVSEGYRHIMTKRINQALGV